MTNFKFTGTNIAAAVLVLAYFFPWISFIGVSSMSGFSITSTGVSPGMMKFFLGGPDRLLMVLVILVPVCGALILYQNVSGEKKFEKYYKPAHLAPAIFLLLGIVILYFKLAPDTPKSSGMVISDRFTHNMNNNFMPGIFDVLSIGVYISLAAAIYLLLVSMGRVKDKEYYKPSGNEPPAAKPGSGL